MFAVTLPHIIRRRLPGAKRLSSCTKVVRWMTN